MRTIFASDSFIRIKQAFLGLLFSVMVISGIGQQVKTPPNIVVILADDLGWADLTCYGSSFYETPNLDRLAARGIRFTQAYATSPVCSPTRASLLTGKYPVRTGVTDWIPGRREDGVKRAYESYPVEATGMQLNLEETTIAEAALQNGYKTFFVGKWHLGDEAKYWPEHQGFQVNKGGWGKGSPTGRVNEFKGGFFTPYANPTLPDGPEGEYLTDRLTNECLSFIDQSKQTPFFLFYSLYAVHNPMQAPKDLIEKYKKKQAALGVQQKFAKDEPWMKLEEGWKRRLVQDNAVYAAMMENMDQNIGKIMDKLDALGIGDNTLIIFTCDNGGLSTAEGSPTTNAPLRSGKGWLYEGGIRVPFILSWRSDVQPQESDLPVTAADVYPTLLSVMQEKPIGKYQDGVNIFSMLKKKDAYQQRPIFWHYPHYSNQGGKPAVAVRSGKFKLIHHLEDKRTELFNLSADIGEQNDILQSQPKEATRLQKLLNVWLKSVGAANLRLSN